MKRKGQDPLKDISFNIVFTFFVASLGAGLQLHIVSLPRGQGCFACKWQPKAFPMTKVSQFTFRVLVMVHKHIWMLAPGTVANDTKQAMIGAIAIQPRTVRDGCAIFDIMPECLLVV